MTSDQKFSKATSTIPIVMSAGDLLLTLRAGGNVTECLGRWQSKRANDWSCSRGYFQVFREGGCGPSNRGEAEVSC